MSEYLRFSTNIPEIVSLKFSEGLPCKSKVNDEDQVMFTLADERRMYLSPYAAKLISDQGIRKSQPFSICKREHREGAVKSIRWEVKLVGEPQPEGQAPAAVAAPLITEAYKQQPNGIANGNGHTNGNGLPKPAGDVVEQRSFLLRRLLLETVDTAHAAEQHAQTLHCELRFTSEDVRCMAISLYISATNGGR